MADRELGELRVSSRAMREMKVRRDGAAAVAAPAMLPGELGADGGLTATQFKQLLLAHLQDPDVAALLARATQGEGGGAPSEREVLLPGAPDDGAADRITPAQWAGPRPVSTSRITGNEADAPSDMACSKEKKEK